jgi:hypothetical protein
LKVEFFNHRTLGQAAKVTTRTLTLFYVLDGIWRDADSVEAVVLTKVPEIEWARDGWFGIAKRQTAAEL